MKVREVYPGRARRQLRRAADVPQRASTWSRVTSLALLQRGLAASPTTSPAEQREHRAAQPDATILIADTGYATAFPAAHAGRRRHEPQPSPAGGAVCWKDRLAAGLRLLGKLHRPAACACATHVVGSPASPGGVTAGQALRRSIASGCATCSEQAATRRHGQQRRRLLRADAQPARQRQPGHRDAVRRADAADDDHRHQAGEPHQDAPAPPSPTTASPAGATFECKLDAAAFASCRRQREELSGTRSLEGSHTFQVRATTETAPARRRRSYTWTVDTDGRRPRRSTPSRPTRAPAPARRSPSTPASQLDLRMQPLARAGRHLHHLHLRQDLHEPRRRRIHLQSARNRPGGQSRRTRLIQWTVDNSLADTTRPETTIVTNRPTRAKARRLLHLYIERARLDLRMQTRLRGVRRVRPPGSPTPTSATARIPSRCAPRTQRKTPTLAGRIHLRCRGPGPPPAPPPDAPRTRRARQSRLPRPTTAPLRSSSTPSPARAYQCSVDRSRSRPVARRSPRRA